MKRFGPRFFYRGRTSLGSSVVRIPTVGNGASMSQGDGAAAEGTEMSQPGPAQRWVGRVAERQQMISAAWTFRFL